MISRLLEWLLGSPLVAFERGALELSVGWPAYAVATGLIGVGVWGLLGYRRVAALSRRERLVLTAIRTVALSLALLCLLRPQLVLSLVVPQENMVGVLLDDSASMQIADAGGGDEPRGEALRRAFPADAAAAPEALSPLLGEKFVTRFFRFSDTVERLSSPGELTFRGPRTNLGRALSRVAEELGSSPLAGVVLVTDGADTVTGAGAAGGGKGLDEVLLDLRARGVRVYPVAVGASEFEPDLELGRPDLPPRVLRGSLLEVRIPVRAQGLGGRTARLDVLDEGRIATTGSVRFEDDEAETAFTVLVPVEEAGARRFRFRVAPLAGEVMTRNNERSALVEVEDRAVEILYFEGQPRWEMKFLRRAVSEDPEIRVVCLLRTAEGKFYRLDVASPEELAGGFPDTREELFRYAGVILGSVEASFFTQDQLDMLRDLVSRRGGGLLTLGGGSAYAEGGYRETPLAEILPLSLDEAPTAPAADGGSPAESRFRELRVSPTRAGASHPVVRLDADPAAGAERYRGLPPLSSVNLRALPKPGASVLLEGAPAGGDSEPVLAFQRFGRGRVASLTVQDLWVWQMDASVAVEDQTHELLWRRLLRWLASEAPRRVELTAAPASALVGEPVALSARVEDERFLAVNSAAVEAAVTAPDGRVEVVPLLWTGREDGEYSGAFHPAATGRYRVEARVSSAEPAGGGTESTDEEGPAGGGEEAERSAGGTPVSAFASFEAGRVDDEFFDAEADPELLSRIAEATGGRVFGLDEGERLALDLSLAASGATVVERRDLWNAPALFLLIFGLLATEWSLRAFRRLP